MGESSRLAGQRGNVHGDYVSVLLNVLRFFFQPCVFSLEETGVRVQGGASVHVQAVRLHAARAHLALAIMQQVGPLSWDLWWLCRSMRQAHVYINMRAREGY